MTRRAPPGGTVAWADRAVRPRSPAPAGERRADAGVAGNARLTAANAAVLLVLLAAEGVTILRVHRLLSPHVFIGVVLIPPVLLKVASTTWRFARYYTGAPAYRRKGAPPVLLRLLGPVVVILTLVLLFSGVGLLLVSRPWLPLLLKVHKASFVLWFGAMTIHVLGHLGRGVPAGPAGLAAPDPARGHRGRNPPVADRGQPGGRRHARISPAQSRGPLAVSGAGRRSVASGRQPSQLRHRKPRLTHLSRNPPPAPAPTRRQPVRGC